MHTRDDAWGGWVVEQHVDPDWYSGHGEVSLGPCPAAGLAKLLALDGASQVIGRQSVSRNIVPDIDCSPDTGVSRRHAGLSVDDAGRLFLEDLGSANGTFLARASEAIPDLPIPVGRHVEVSEGDQIYLGAWTRLVIRHPDAETVILDGSSAETRVLDGSTAAEGERQ